MCIQELRISSITNECGAVDDTDSEPPMSADVVWTSILACSPVWYDSAVLKHIFEYSVPDVFAQHGPGKSDLDKSRWPTVQI